MTIFRKKGNACFLVFLFISLVSAAQPSPSDDFLPKDYLPASFHAGRRDALRSSMPDSSVVVIFAYPTRTFSNDVEYIYHANPDMYYFSGYKEPHSLLMMNYYLYRKKMHRQNNGPVKDWEWMVQRKNWE
jgi:Xaa-Pro aminopeptidase